ncbi:putative Dol-P-Glc:Glc(2)Man(9)GlcNAc(2)-PP-Dol alpha-1,2-glucosyltransferase [Caerostris extrusa]|uniref:Dol-P-Glc:Glc(2)Man(9)GlcNAc(2)-PP-Dol alpha-1,2-glucosyltransferase n=1 Tax=Caerostris extrusa TaxID=172846 RepID=A0AAV4VG58_CAEEX|nr:putative Dol-P-Glc:Glc(2)Man(9)GlcNAc(2)-PP-Dol alpha-1,2-glucosyltransferase [Caerostris extrusa]
MDEIFHFPQAVKYYTGIYNEWDPKITTPPGLYLFTIAILRPFSKITNLNVVEIACFRFSNIIYTVGTIYIIHRILQHHHKKREPRVLLLSSFNITTFPVLYFFNFLLLYRLWLNLFCFIDVLLASKKILLCCIHSRGYQHIVSTNKYCLDILSLTRGHV